MQTQNDLTISSVLDVTCRDALCGAKWKRIATFLQSCAECDIAEDFGGSQNWRKVPRMLLMQGDRKVEM